MSSVLFIFSHIAYKNTAGWTVIQWGELYETSKLVNPQEASYKLIYKLYWKPGKQASITNSKSGTFTDPMRSMLKVIHTRWCPICNNSTVETIHPSLNFFILNLDSTLFQFILNLENKIIWTVSHCLVLLFKTTNFKQKTLLLEFFSPCTISSHLPHSSSHQVIQSQNNIK